MNNRFCTSIKLIHITGDILFPVRITDRKTNQSEFRLTKGSGNTKEDSIKINDEKMLKKYIKDLNFKVRASTLDGKRQGLYRSDGYSLKGVQYL